MTSSLGSAVVFVDGKTLPADSGLALGFAGEANHLLPFDGIAGNA
jgi:hypothetical protein